MRLKTKYFTSFVLVFLLCGLAQNANATHISKPVFSKSQTEYFIGEKIVLDGWVNYNHQPTADVLLDFKVLGPDGAIANQQSFSSDSHGQFKFKFDTTNLAPGMYQVTVTSQCLEVHRPICTHKSQTLSIKLKFRSSKTP
ncbi:MAG: hypothetical protein Q8K59_01325 [Nitrosomonas sp.]|nr:hypothetical protein [Nitrosomonas sp.]MDP1949742.1 hypothetical protein [Nitrosomonas sp.]